jgi:uncharacterized protein YbjT (DUF2867 family)
MSADKNTIAVIGATGTQGGGVVRSLIKDGTFAVRAITRNPSSASSQGDHKHGGFSAGISNMFISDGYGIRL